MDFIANILADLDDKAAKTKLDNLVKDRDINLTAKIDDTQIKNIARSLSQNKALQITAHIKDTSLKNMQNQLNTMAKGLNINFGNAFNINNTANSAKKYGQQVGNLISTQAQNAIKNVSSTGINKYFKVSQSDSDAFRKEMDKLVSGWTSGKGKLTDVKIQTRTSYDKDAQRNIERLHQAQVTYNNELGESIKKTIAWRQVGTTQDKNGNDIPIRGFVEVASQYSKTLDATSTKTDNFIKTQQKAISRLSNQSKDIYRDAIDKNASKPIKDQLHLDEIEKRYKEINTEIGKLNNLNGTDFSNQENHINSLINDLKIYKREARNAESTATALRSKPIDVVRDETSKKVQGLESDIKKAGVSSKELTSYIDEINTALSNPNIDASGINNVLNTMSKAREEMGRLKKELSTSQTLEKVQIKSDGLTKDIQKAISDNLNLGNFETEINGVKVSVSSLLNDLSQVKTTGDISVITEKWKSFSSAAKEAGVMAESAVDNVRKLEKYTDTFNNGKYSADSKTMSANLEKYNGQNTDSLEKARNYLKEYQDTYKEIQNHFDTTSAINFKDDELVQKFDKLETAASKYRNVMREVSTESTKTLSANAGIIKSNEILTYYNNNTKAVKKYGAELRQLVEDAKKVTTQGEMDVINEKFKKLKYTISAEGLTGKSWIDDAKRAFGQIAQFTGMYGILQNVMQDVPRAIVQNVIKIDDAMTNLRMATSVSNDEAQKLMKTYSEMGKELKVLGTDIATSSTEWLKQGKSIQESEKLTKDSVILSKIGDLSSEDATKTITAAMKSYDLAESQVMGFIDQISSIDMASATDVGGLSQAFNEVAANAKNAGIETEKLLSYAAVIGETSQEGMASVGTSLNAIFSRMGNIKLSRLKDYENDGEDLSNVETVLKKNGIALRDATGQFKEFDDVLDETASKWKNFDSVTQRAVANAFAGTHHANNFMILMEQYDQARKYMDIASTSSGESIEKFTAYQESLSGSIEGFKNAAQSLSNTALDSSFLKGIVNTGTGAIEVLDWLIDKFGILQTLIGGFAIGKGITSFVKSFDKPACKVS